MTHTHPFNGPLSGTTQVSRYQKGKTNLDFAETRDSKWQWHQLDHALLQVASRSRQVTTPPLGFLQAGWMPFLMLAYMTLILNPRPVQSERFFTYRHNLNHTLLCMPQFTNIDICVHVLLFCS